MKNNEKILSIVLKIVGTFLLTILVVISAIFSNIHIGPFTVSLALVPIVMGATLCGIVSGAWLGLVFGITVLLSGDASVFLSINAFGTIITVLSKGILAGVLSGLIYKILEKIHYSIATITAGIICPLVNTGIFLVGLKLFFNDWTVAVLGTTDTKAMISVFAGSNFIFELIINLVIASFLVIIIKTVLKIISKNKKTDNYTYIISEEKNTVDKLLEYKELLDMGAITQEEFEAKKKELL